MNTSKSIFFVCLFYLMQGAAKCSFCLHLLDLSAINQVEWRQETPGSRGQSEMMAGSYARGEEVVYSETKKQSCNSFKMSLLHFRTKIVEM